ncbi:MAG TPA: 5'-nucleotidase C-terminal domain-containing protein, partial [Polyangiaceae bacterium]|nr:5'-nucleotidase C-terminal domain-containing protein [Polyangiaceae bacterium]
QSPPGLSEPSNDWQLAAAPDLAGAVQLAIDDLAPRVELVIVLSHLGLDADHALVQGTSGIAAVLGGHQHVLTAEPEWEDDCAAASVSEARGCSPRRVPIVHSGAYGQWLSRIVLSLAPDLSRGGALSVLGAEHTPLPVSEKVPEAPEIVAYLATKQPPVEPPLAFLSAPLPRRSALGADSALGDWTTDAVLAASGADVVLLNSSGLREDVEAGVLLRSDLELAFPFAEPWRLARLRGDRLRRGLLSAAWRSAARDCEASLQVAGLRLQIDCNACEQRVATCLRVERDTALGRVPLADDEWLLVALPRYLTLSGADFEDAAAGAELDISVPDALARRFAPLPSVVDVARCAAAVESRCSDAWEAAACPLSEVRARAICEDLPLVEGSRDGRIEMLP